MPIWDKRTALTGIIDRYINTQGHRSIFVYGEKGAGKSTYALLSALAYYKDWDKVLKKCLFTREEIMNSIHPCFDFEKKTILKRIPILIWDDATYENMRERKRDRFIEEFAKFYTLIRKVVPIFIWTAPSFTLLPSKLQSMEWIVIRITRIDSSKSMAHFYKYNQSPTGKVFLSPYYLQDRKITETFYFNWINKKDRARYETMRERYTVEGYLETLRALKIMKQQKVTEDKMVEAFKQAIKQVVKKGDTPEK